MKSAFVKLKNFALHTSAGRILTIFFAFALVMNFAGENTVSYLLTTPDASSGGNGIVNEYAYPYIDCTITGVQNNEQLTEVTKVTITPDSNINCFVRAVVVMTWQDEQGHVFGTLPKEYADYFEIEMVKDKWIQRSDGYYYCVEPTMNQGAELIIRCSRGIREAPDGYHLCLEVMGEAIQADPLDAAKNAWGVTITNGKITG